MKIVAFVPIRLNSKRVASKSLRLLGGRPLFCWLLEALDKLNVPTHVFCSQNEVLKSLVDFESNNLVFTNRPVWLDGDDVKGIDIYRDFAREVESEVYLLSHCTSPFVTSDSLKKVMDSVVTGKATSCATVARIQTFTWFDGKPLNFGIPRIQTQLLHPVFYETSAAYCYRREILDSGDRTDLQASLVELEWPEAEDIDTESDFQRCEAIAAMHQKKT